ncbi:hypothetical protein AN958_08950 [Leucoagaricus sp. SymC.cos]|nr:hypothetical protein AN958_08950 [Leucoagaricus sp. SymC.cos]
MYGFAFALYCLSAWSLFKQRKDPDQSRKSLFALGHISIVMACGLIKLAVDTRGTQLSYIDHADYPDGGAYFYDANVFATTSVATASDSLMIFLDCLLFGTQIWRLWIVWSISRYVYLIVLVPTLSLLTYLALQIVTFTQIELITALQLDAVLEGLNLLTDLLITIPILLRVILVRRHHAKIIGHSALGDGGSLISVVAMIVESFAIVSIWVTAEIVVTSLISKEIRANSVIYLILAESEQFMRIIAYILLVYRVTTGRAWKRDTERQLTTLQWNRDPQTTGGFTTRLSLSESPEQPESSLLRDRGSEGANVSPTREKSDNSDITTTTV